MLELEGLEERVGGEFTHTSDYMKCVIFESMGNIGIVRLNRKKVLNAINSKMLHELEMAFDELNTDKIRVVIVTGEGKNFASGADVKEIFEIDSEKVLKSGSLGQKVFLKIEEYEKPTIAMIDGFCLGGGLELALSCDLRIASTRAKFGFPEVRLGIFPGWGGTQRLARLCGKGKTKALIFSGEIISARDAFEIGLVENVVTAKKLQEECLSLAHKIAENAPIAVKMAKKSINFGVEVDLKTGLEFENELSKLCFFTKDREEGLRAFLEKRKPKFSGR